MITFTELTATESIAKEYGVDEQGEIVVKSAPNIYSATAKQVHVPVQDMSNYLDLLNKSKNKCILLGVHDGDEEEYDLTTVEKRSGKQISRSLDYFDWANHGATGIFYLDFDSKATDVERDEFLNDLDMLLSDALIGESGIERAGICKWKRGSSSSCVKINGVAGTGLHVFMPIKGDVTGITKLIHQWCWMNHKGWKLTEAGTILSESLIDPLVGSPERIVFTSNAIVEECDIIKEIDRVCSYSPGGVLDAELTRNILEEVCVDFRREWRSFKSSIESSEEVRDIRRAWKKKQIENKVKSGMSRKEAKKSVKALMNSEILSNESLLRNNGDLVSVLDILTDPDSWLGKNKFCDPIKQDVNRNVGMIMGTEERPFLNSKSHGGVRYWLKWTFEDLLEWVTTCDVDELEDWFIIHATNCDLLSSQENVISKKIGARIGASAGSVNMDVKVVRKERCVEDEATKRVEDARSDGIGGGDTSSVAGDSDDVVWLNPDASHGDIMDDYLRRAGDCMTFGDGLYTWEGGSIWKCQNSGVIQKRLRSEYNHVKKCQRITDYRALAGAIIVEDDICVDRWNETVGFPCSDGFYRVTDETVEKVPYTKDLMCRFKMGIKPDFKMETPLWDMVVRSVENPVLFQQLAGLAVSGKLPELQKVFVMFGHGGTGKGTAEAVFSAMLPRDRMTSISLSQMNDEKYRVQLAGSRVNFLSEVSKVKKVDLTGLKEIVGGGLVTGRALFQGPVSFYPCCTFVLSTNRWFPMDETGTSAQRRLGDSIVQFVKRHEEVIGNLADKIVERELPGVLAWCIGGVELWQEHGLESQLSNELWSKWVSSIDPISLFVEECVSFGHQSSSVKRSELWDRFSVFCDESKYFVMKKGEFFSLLEDVNGFNKLSLLHGDWVFRGVRFV